MINLFKVSFEDWQKANLYFKANKNAIKMKRGVSGVTQSFLRVGGKIIAMAPKVKIISKTDIVHKTPILGEGSFTRAKVVQDESNHNYAILIEPEAEPGMDKKAEENAILTQLGRFMGMDERKLDKPIEVEHNHTKMIARYKLYRLTTLFPGENLQTVIDSKKLNEAQLTLICVQTLIEVIQLHGRNILHNDLKPDNMKVVLKDALSSGLSILDYGFSAQMKENQLFRLMNRKGTAHYMAPEIKAKGLYSFYSDIYALGVMFKDIGLPSSIWNDMIATNPIERSNHETILLRLYAHLKSHPQHTPEIKRQFLSALLPILPRLYESYMASKPEATRRPLPALPAVKKAAKV